MSSWAMSSTPTTTRTTRPTRFSFRSRSPTSSPTRKAWRSPTARPSTYFSATDQLQQLAPATRPVNVVEPNIQVAKTVQPLAVLTTGGTVTYTITLTNPSGNSGGARLRPERDGRPRPVARGEQRDGERGRDQRRQRQHAQHDRRECRGVPARRPARHHVPGRCRRVASWHAGGQHRDRRWTACPGRRAP